MLYNEFIKNDKMTQVFNLDRTYIIEVNQKGQKQIQDVLANPWYVEQYV